MQKAKRNEEQKESAVHEPETAQPHIDREKLREAAEALRQARGPLLYAYELINHAKNKLPSSFPDSPEFYSWQNALDDVSTVHGELSCAMEDIPQAALDLVLEPQGQEQALAFANAYAKLGTKQGASDAS